MSEIEKKWYVLRAISGKEAKVKEYLEADIKNSDLGDYVSQVLIPTEKVYQVRNGKKIVKERRQRICKSPKGNRCKHKYDRGLQANR